MPKEKRGKPVDKLKDRELAERLLGKEAVEKLHEDFDLMSKKGNDDFTPSRSIGCVLVSDPTRLTLPTRT